MTPDQFWRTRVLGNVRERPFSAIWSDSPFLGDLRRRTELLTGRCGTCPWLPICNGNLRVRAESATGDPGPLDSACYLTDAELGEGRDALAAS